MATYRFTDPDGADLGTADAPSDEEADAQARELSRSGNVPVVVHRHSGVVDAWEYVTEVDERP